MKVSGQLHASATAVVGKDPTVLSDSKLELLTAGLDSVGEDMSFLPALNQPLISELSTRMK
jgi:hypothetical protein